MQEDFSNEATVVAHDWAPVLTAVDLATDPQLDRIAATLSDFGIDDGGEMRLIAHQIASDAGLSDCPLESARLRGLTKAAASHVIDTLTEESVVREALRRAREALGQGALTL